MHLKLCLHDLCDSTIRYNVSHVRIKMLKIKPKWLTSNISLALPTHLASMYPSQFSLHMFTWLPSGLLHTIPFFTKQKQSVSVSHHHHPSDCYHLSTAWDCEKKTTTKSNFLDSYILWHISRELCAWVFSKWYTNTQTYNNEYIFYDIIPTCFGCSTGFEPFLQFS